MIRQPRLFDARTIDERFEVWVEAHGDVYRLFVRFALELLAAGRKEYSAKAIVERIRWHYATSSSAFANGFKVSNDFTSRLARKAMNENPPLRGFFRLKPLRAA